MEKEAMKKKVMEFIISQKQSNTVLSFNSITEHIGEILDIGPTSKQRTENSARGVWVEPQQIPSEILILINEVIWDLIIERVLTPSIDYNLLKDLVLQAKTIVHPGSS